MSWIKRNLYFTIGGVIVLGLMGFGGWFFYTQYSLEKDLREKIMSQYGELQRLNNENPRPGDDKVNNIQIARDQQKQLRDYIIKLHSFIQPIPPIPENTNKISNAEFAAQLRNTVALLRRTATNQSVIPPQDYYFTFESQRRIMQFDAASLPRLAVQLGEVKAICEILFNAKVNSLIGIRRESVSPNDQNPPDYLPDKTVSTPLADYSPYEVTFQSFSTELAQVMSAFANSSNGLVVKSINVEPASEATEGEMTANNPQPQQAPPMNIYMNEREREMRQRQMSSPSSAPAPASRPNATFLNEKPLRITMRIDIVKLKAMPK